MRTFLVILLIAFVQVSVAQDSTAIQKLQNQFREVYYNHKDPNANFFNRLYGASIAVFSLENDVFYDELTTEKRRIKLFQMTHWRVKYLISLYPGLHKIICGTIIPMRQPGTDQFLACTKKKCVPV